jgi:hypothetical protein
MNRYLTPVLFACIVALDAAGQTALTISPSSGSKGQTLAVTITGTSTHFTQASNTVAFFRQGSPTSEVTVPHANATSNTVLTGSMFISASATTGLYTFKVGNAVDGILQGGSFTVGLSSSGGTLSSISPSTANKGQTLNVTITGTNTHFTTGSNTVLFRQGTSTTAIKVNSTTALSATQLRANISVLASAATGVYNLFVSNLADGIMNLASAFTVNTATSGSPSLVSVSPSSANAGDQLTVTITGTNTSFTSPTSFLSFGFLQGTSTMLGTHVAATSATTFNGDVSVPADAAGVYSLNVISLTDGLLTLPNAFTVFPATGTKNLMPGEIAKIYPNPVHGKLVVEAGSNSLETIEVFDISGRLVYSSAGENMPAKSEIDVTGFDAGIYFVKLRNGKATQTSKVVVE